MMMCHELGRSVTQKNTCERVQGAPNSKHLSSNRQQVSRRAATKQARMDLMSIMGISHFCFASCIFGMRRFVQLLLTFRDQNRRAITPW